MKKLIKKFKNVAILNLFLLNYKRFIFLTNGNQQIESNWIDFIDPQVVLKKFNLLII